MRAWFNKLLVSISGSIKELKYYWHLKELIHKMEHPIFSFHYKLLNCFSKQSLENICLKYFDNYPVLNISLIKTKAQKDEICYLFLPHYINGFYINGIEVSVDLDETDYAIIEDEENKISVQDCLKLLDIKI